MLNEALIRSGYAQDKDYGDRLYASQFGEARAFAKRWNLGVYSANVAPLAWSLLQDLERVVECSRHQPRLRVAQGPERVTSATRP